MSDAYPVLVTATRSEPHLHSLNKTYTGASLETHFTVAISETRVIAAVSQTHFAVAVPKKQSPKTRFTVAVPKTHSAVAPHRDTFHHNSPRDKFHCSIS